MVKIRISPQLKFLLLGLSLSLFGIELLLRLLPVRTDHNFAANDIKKPVLQAQATTIVEPLDWKFAQAQERKVNNYGFVDDRDYKAGTSPVAIIGDSYVQSSMLPYADTLQGQLSKKLGNKSPVYSFGIPAYSLAGYIGAAEYADRVFKPRAYVVLLTKGDIIDSVISYGGSYYLNPNLQKLEFQERDESKTQQLLAHSALVRYVVKQLGFKPSNLLPAQAATATSSPSPNRLQQMSATLLKHLAAKSGANPQNTIFVIDSDREYIYGQKSQPDRAEFLAFKEVARSQGYQVIDTHPLFEKSYHTDRRRLDFTPIDLHWNERAHALVAQEVKSKLSPILARFEEREQPNKQTKKICMKMHKTVAPPTPKTPATN
jgi:hypothetical protein